MGEFNVEFLKLCIHQYNQNQCLEFLTVNVYRIIIQTRGVAELAEGMEQRRHSEGEDSNRAMAVREILDSDNEIYLTILNK
jgi:hypothetical protein